MIGGVLPVVVGMMLDSSISPSSSFVSISSSLDLFVFHRPAAPKDHQYSLVQEPLPSLHTLWTHGDKSNRKSKIDPDTLDSVSIPLLLFVAFSSALLSKDGCCICYSSQLNFVQEFLGIIRVGRQGNANGFSLLGLKE
jgi:hypothetical protein